MQRRIFCSLFFWAVCGVITAQRLQAAPAFKGMSYTAFGPANVLDSANSNASLLKMSLMGADTVALNTWWFQTAYNSNSVQEEDNRYSATSASIGNAIDYIHNTLHMKVLLKPMLDVDDGNWRAYVSPTNPNAWFGYTNGATTPPISGSYGDYIGKMADIAQAHNVEMFSIGCEMNNMESNTTGWTNIINDLKTNTGTPGDHYYGGKLTYSANFSGAYGGPQNLVNVGGYTTVPFWNQLDEVGIDAYYSLTSSNSPTQTQLNNAWSSIASSLNTWRNNNTPTQKILFTETGYGSYDGSNKTPYDNYTSHSGAAVDTTEQSMAYRALMTTMSQQSWWDGAFWWNWTTDPNAGGASDKNYTPQNKAAQQTLSEFYLLRGDFNLDHQVTNADLQAMLNTLKNESGFDSTNFFTQADLNALGDFNGDGVVDTADIQGELALLTGSSGSSSTSAVPEPASVVLLGLALLTCQGRSRRRHRMQKNSFALLR